MPNQEGRQALRGAEVGLLDLMVEIMTPKEWAKLLEAPLMAAVNRRNRGLAVTLLRAGAETGYAVHRAMWDSGGKMMLNDLLGNGASLDYRDSCGGNTPLHRAVISRDMEVMRLLLSKGAGKDTLNHIEKTPLFLAVCFDFTAGALALIAAGADVNVRCYRKSTMVQEAARQGNVDILRAMIEHGADVNAADRDEITPLHEAGRFNHTEAINILLEAGANPQARAGDGTPLHCAAPCGNTEAVLALLKHGADINARDSQGRTPLHCVCLSLVWGEEIAGMVDLLLRSGADETVVDENEETAESMIDEAGIYGGDPLDKDVERAHLLSANNRRWRRRGYLVLCRAHPDRVRRVQESSSKQMAGH